MKRKITLLAMILLAQISSAQNQPVAGKSGTLIKNEATEMEMKSPTNTQNTAARTATGNMAEKRIEPRNNNRQTNGVRGNRNANYRWNSNFGYSEVFLRIPEQGYFTVQLNDQVISSDTGKYRFFDLNAGRNVLYIYENGYLIYRAPITLQNNTRLVLDYFYDYGLYKLDAYPIRNNTYGFNSWDDVWNNSYQNNWNNNQNQHWDNFQNNGNYLVMNQNEFNQFFTQLKRNANFDDDKIAFIGQLPRSQYFSSSQIKKIVREMRFSDGELQMAKLLYPRCADKQNFNLIYDEISFISAKRDLMDFIAQYENRR